ncbi:MAG: metal-binding protein [Gammaproteobacteria bacterium]|nr:MAG: metal-binding protein [Gammaproteobacteria bacterium]
MSSHLPEYVAPLSLAEKGCLIKGEYPLASLARLQGMLACYEGNVRFDLNFERKGRMRVITGSVLADLGLDCQVCMEAIDLSVDRKVSLSVVTSIEQAERLPEEYEALLLESVEETVVLMDIVEDELLLALPDVAKHGDCSNGENINEEAEREESVNPFSVLANLKKD